MAEPRKYAVEFTDLETGTREIYGAIPRIFPNYAEAKQFAALMPTEVNPLAITAGPAIMARIYR